MPDLAEIEQIYRRLTGSSRDLRAGDRLQDLGIDSLVVSEMLVALEDRHGLDLIGDPRIAAARTVEEFLVAVASAPEMTR